MADRTDRNGNGCAELGKSDATAQEPLLTLFKEQAGKGIDGDSAGTVRPNEAGRQPHWRYFTRLYGFAPRLEEIYCDGGGDLQRMTNWNSMMTNWSTSTA